VVNHVVVTALLQMSFLHRC